MIYVGIRHSCDQKSHTDIKHQHDAPLCSNPQHHQQGVQRQVRELLEQKLIPSVILTSPFLRCQKSAKMLAKEVARRTGRKIKVKVSVPLSRLFVGNESDSPDISRRTAAYHPPIYESSNDFDRRIRTHIVKTQRKYSNQIVWGVTHALVLNKMLQLGDPENFEHQHMNPLEAVILG